MSPAISSLSRSVGIERRQVVEEDLVARDLGVLEVDRLDLDQGEVALALLGRAHLAGDGVAGAQVEAADLGGRDVDVVRAGQVVVVGRAQEAEAVGQALEHALGEDQAALLGLRLQDLEDQLLLAQPVGALDPEVFGDLGELPDAMSLSVRMSRVSLPSSLISGLAGLPSGFASDLASALASALASGTGSGSSGLISNFSSGVTSEQLPGGAGVCGLGHDVLFDCG